MATSTQRLAVVLAFIAAALSFTAVAVGYARNGEIRVTPLGGGAVMLALAFSGYKRITTPRP
jgi:lipopolysaccharide export LptBFGC system permease protein LptF